jgi:hypothetical protein
LGNDGDPVSNLFTISSTCIFDIFLLFLSIYEGYAIRTIPEPPVAALKGWLLLPPPAPPPVLTSPGVATALCPDAPPPPAPPLTDEAPGLP